MEQHYISESNLAELVGRLSKQYSVFHPVASEEGLHLTAYPNNGSPDGSSHTGTGSLLGEVRPCEPLKAFFFTARKCVAVGFDEETATDVEKPICLVGVKACDLKSLQVLDSVFVDTDYIDPFYNAAREKNLIISADCTAALDTCFCVALEGKPFPESSFDMNLSSVDGGYVVDVATEKGERLVSENQALFTSPTSEQLQGMNDLRRRVEAEVRAKVQEHEVPAQDELAGVVAKTGESTLWQEEAETCVECGACNVICPTCHCFLLYDQQNDDRMARFRLWDSCLIRDFAQVAGGANPRPRLWMRLRNRFEKKFDFFPNVKGIYACTGCGRCISACPGKIDIRRVLKRNVESVRA